ncbi:MAG TPA: branched-chain amino acid ABC transporter permease [Acidimicrobiales bacterium]|nr:branched-chain amino acid ABC transporter permease [Acidimicrobiales bacterium]
MRRVVLALLGALAVTIGTAHAAGAGPHQEPPPATDPTATTVTTATGEAGEAGAQPSPGGEVVRGTLFYKDDEGERVAVDGVEITVEDATGTEVASAETDDEGAFEIPLPGPGNYAATVDEDALPDGVTLQNDRATLSFQMDEGRSRGLLFPLGTGEGGRNVSTTLDRAVRLAVQGLRFGLIIAMCSIGLSLIFGTTRLTNFAHGEMVTFGAIVAWVANVTYELPMWLSTALALVIACLAGGVVDRYFWRPLRNRGTGLIAMMVVSIGVSIAVRYVFLYQFGGSEESYGEYTLQKAWEIGPLRIVPRDFWGMVISVVVLVAVALVLQRSRVGKATRAVADNIDLAESSGINVDRVITFVWVAGAGLAALGGILQGLSEQVTWQMGFQLLLLMFAGTTLGGLGTAYGALVGSVVVGVAMEMSTLVIPSEFKTVTALAILVIILLVRPQGILGQAERVG